MHVDGTARIQTVDRADEPLVARMLERFERRTGLPVVVNTSLNTAGRPMVDDPRDALECFGSAPVDLLGHRPLPRTAGPVAVTSAAYAVVVPTVGRPSLDGAADLARRVGTASCPTQRDRGRRPAGARRSCRPFRRGWPTG